MSTISVALIDDNLELCQSLQQHLLLRLEFENIAIINDFQKIIQLLKNQVFDVLVISLFNNQFDTLEILKWLKISSLSPKPKIITYAAVVEEEFLSQTIEFGIDYFMLKPFEISILTQRIIEIAQGVFRTTCKQENNFQVLENAVEKMINNINIPNHFKGYLYLKDAIIFTIQEPKLVNQITQKLYPLIGLRHTATVCQIERSIRFAIETVWNKGDIEFLNNLFGYCVDGQKGKPTNASFIAKIADQIRLEIRKPC